MEEDAAALDMAEEAVAEAGALVRAFDQAGDVGEDESRPPPLTTPRLGWSVVKG